MTPPPNPGSLPPSGSWPSRGDLSAVTTDLARLRPFGRPLWDRPTEHHPESRVSLGATPTSSGENGIQPPQSPAPPIDHFPSQPGQPDVVANSPIVIGGRGGSGVGSRSQGGGTPPAGEDARSDPRCLPVGPVRSHLPTRHHRKPIQHIARGNVAGVNGQMGPGRVQPSGPCTTTRFSPIDLCR